jgi:hypothetical protein
MRPHAAQNLIWMPNESSRRGEGDIVALLLAVFLLAAIGPLVCIFFCHPSQGMPVTTQICVASQCIADTGIPQMPSRDAPVTPASSHCLAHHSCCQFGPLLSFTFLAPFLVVLGLWLHHVLITPQPGSAPATPPPQLAYC